MTERTYDALARDALALTVLRTDDGRRLVKRFHLTPEGAVARQDFDEVKWYTACCFNIDGVEQLHGVIEMLEGLSDCCVVRGAMTMESGTRTRRLKSEFPEVPRRWVMLDLDGADLLPGVRVADDPHWSACALVKTLACFAPELDGVSSVVRWSTSAATAQLAEYDTRWSRVAKAGLSAHVWYVLSEALGAHELKLWIAEVNRRAGIRLLDPATVRTVQPHYTSAPIFSDGLPDPLRGQRTHLVSGDYGAAKLVIPTSQRQVSPILATRSLRPAAPRQGSACERDASGIIVDGRDAHLSCIAYRLVMEAAEQGHDLLATTPMITDAAWAEFTSTADVARLRSSGSMWCREDAERKVRQKIAALRAGTLPSSSPRSIASRLAALRSLRNGR